MDKISELISLFCCRFTICALNRLGIGCRFFRRAWLSFIGFCRSLYLLNLPFRSGYGSIGLRGRQRPQNRRLKHP